MTKINRREFLKNAAIGLAGISILGSGCKEVLKARKPNIIYILADDLGYGDLGCYGQKKIKTPNLDKMASEGLRFTQHYAGSTVCAPSRCSLMTGKHQGHCTVRGNDDVLMKDGEITIARVLKDAGYTTACIGKWGVGHPPPPDDPHRHGFDYFFGYLSMWHAHNYYPEFLWRNGEKVPLKNVVKHPKEHYKKDQEKLTGFATEKKEYSNDLFTDDAITFISNQQKPFFLYLAYTIPHANNEAEWFGEQGMEVTDYGIYKGKDWPEAEKGKAAMISRLDSYVGRILDKLKELGIDENTMVVFSSDNGPHKEGGQDPRFFDSNGNLRGIKRDLYEGGIRVPMIAWWPGKIEAGKVTDHVSAFWDVLPTFAEAAGAQVPEGIDGISFLPTLLGKTAEQKQHEYLYWEFYEEGGKQAVRMGNWKGVRLNMTNNPDAPVELYNLDNDPEEKINIANQHPEIVQQIKVIMQKAHIKNPIFHFKYEQ